MPLFTPQSARATRLSESDKRPFSIDDAFDIPEEEEEGDSEAEPQAGVVRFGALRRLDEDVSRTAPIIRDAAGHAVVLTLEADAVRDSSSVDSVSLIQAGGSVRGSGSGGSSSGQRQTRIGSSGYYAGPEHVKYWWRHPKIRNNCKVVVAAFLLTFLGTGLIISGIVTFCFPDVPSVQGIVFLIAGLICFLPGAYHIIYIYFAVKGKRGFDFSHLPLFNN